MSEEQHDSWIQRGYQQLQNYDSDSVQNARTILVFIAGILIGWIVIGWWLWPVQYTEVWPNELDSKARSEYFRMVAESYAATQDIGRAAQRLRYWTPQELGPLLQAEIEELRSTDPPVADQLQVIVKLLRLRPGEVPLGERPAARPGILDSLLGLLANRVLRVAIVSLFLLLLAWLIWRRFLRRQPAPAMSLQDMEEEPGQGPHPAPVAVTPEYDLEEPLEDYEGAIPFEEGAPAYPAPQPAPAATLEEEEEPLAVPPTFETEEEIGAEEEGREIAEGEEEGEAEDEGRFQPQPPSLVAPSVTEKALELGPGAERFVFDGDPYYNQIFAIEKEGEYLGEFGMGVGETLADDPSKIITMEVWLFEKRDIRTVTAALMPPELYRDTEQRVELLDDDVLAVPLEPGAQIHLETEGLEILGQVRRVEFKPSIERLPTIRYLELDLVGREKDEEINPAEPPPW